MNAEAEAEIVVEIGEEMTKYPKGDDRLKFQPELGFGLLYNPPSKREKFLFNGLECDFIDYWPFDKKGKKAEVIRARVPVESEESDEDSDSVELETYFKLIPIRRINIGELKRMELWGILSEELKVELDPPVKIQSNVNMTTIKPRQVEVKKVRAKAGDYTGIPREICCSQCGEPKKMAPAQILKRATAKGLTHKEWVKTFVCLVCDPSQRGRKPSGKYEGFVKELKCTHPGCTFVLVQHPSQTEKQAIAVGKTFDEFVKGWLCREHRPKKAHHFSVEGRALAAAEGKPIVKMGRKPNPLYIGIPKSTNCKTCGTSVVLVAQQLVKKAGILGITVDELIKNYKCRKCGGKLTKEEKEAAKKRMESK